MPILELPETSLELFRQYLSDQQPDLLIGINSWFSHAMDDLPESLNKPRTWIFLLMEKRPELPSVPGLYCPPTLLGQRAAQLLHRQLADMEYGVPQIRQTVHLAGQWTDYLPTK